jgi:hypothetical protein
MPVSGRLPIGIMMRLISNYDQLSRLVRANGYNGAAFDAVSGTGSLAEAPTKYHNSFMYDANGNILAPLRDDQRNTNLRNLVSEQTSVDRIEGTASYISLSFGRKVFYFQNFRFCDQLLQFEQSWSKHFFSLKFFC